MDHAPRPIVAVHQPNYAPWLGWFLKAAVADTLVLLDDVQFPKASWVNRTRVLGPGGPEYLTVPVRHPGLAPIREVRIADARWADRHRRRLRAYYHGSPDLAAVLEVLAEEGLDGIDRLSEANEVVARRLLAALGAKATLVRSSSMGIDAADPTERHLAICRRLGARTYLSGQGAVAYNEGERFREAGIALTYLGFDHPVYPQPREPFTPGLSALDFLAATGPGASAAFAGVVRAARLEPAPRAEGPSG